MFWKKQKEINKLTQEKNDLIIWQNEREKRITKLEEEKNRLAVENEKLSNAIREYGNMKVKNISIPYMIDERKEKYYYGKNQWGGGELIHEPKLKTKIIPQIIVNYYEED